MATSSPSARTQTKKATASGWIGSALEYYDFFIYATAASIVFPQLFFPKTDPTIGIILSLATYGVGYVARPIGAFVLGHFGDTHGRKNVLLLCLFLMGFSTMAVGLLPTYQQVGIWAPVTLVLFRLIQGFAVAGEISGSSCMILEHAPFGRRGYFASYTLQGVQAGQIFAAAVFLPIVHYMPTEAFNAWGWRIPFLLSAVVIAAGWYIRREVEETPVFAEEGAQGAIARTPIREAFASSWDDMLRVAVMALMNVTPVVTIFGTTYATQDAYGIGLPKDLTLLIPVLGNIVAVLVIPFVGDWSDRIGRRPLMILGSVGSGALAYAYLWAISIRSVPLMIVIAILMWGVVYQGYNALFPSFYPEQFPARVRVTAMAIAQNVGTAITALMASAFATIAPPGSDNVWLVIGSIAFGTTVLSSIAIWSSRETYRVRVADLGRRDIQPLSADEYDRLRASAA